MTGPIGELDHVVFTVPEMAEACRVWQDVLGFAPIKSGERWTVFEAGQITVALSLAEDGAQVASSCPEVVFKVADIRAALKRTADGGLVLIDAEREICAESGRSFRYARVALPGGVLGLYQRIDPY